MASDKIPEMSLILGLHLLNKLYLVSDTRITYVAGKTRHYDDNQLKFEAINPKTSVVVAGNAHQAAYIVNLLRKTLHKRQNIIHLRDYLEKNIEDIATKYLQHTNNPSLSVFIFTGFTGEKTKTINSTKLGRVMSAEIRKHGYGQQSINKQITSALVSEISKKGILKKDDPIEVSTRNSIMFTLEFDTKENSFTFKDIECFEYAMFHPGYKVRSLPIPDELISILEFRNIKGLSTEDVLYEDAEILTNFVNRQIRENNFETVGGHILPILQSHNMGVLFPTGDLAQIKKGEVVKAGAIYVENEKICYELPNGTKGIYNKLDFFLSNKDLLSAFLNLSIMYS